MRLHLEEGEGKRSCIRVQSSRKKQVPMRMCSIWKTLVHILMKNHAVYSPQQIGRKGKKKLNTSSVFAREKKYTGVFLLPFQATSAITVCSIAFEFNINQKENKNDH